MPSAIRNFKVVPPIKLSGIDTRPPFDKSDDALKEALEDVRKKLAKRQDKMYAHNRYAMLICLQGMDTSGKDSLIREVFRDLNARGIVVHSFKVPTSSELEHDYLWRHYLALPEKGKVAVFNRTHYENVIATRVHPEYILNENLPGIETVADIDRDFWVQRFAQIRHFESHIVRNGTIVLKFYLHLSKEEQRQRLLRRLEEEKHNWKFSISDLEERTLWEKYMTCYEEAINATSTQDAPWYIIPADHKEAARLIVAQIILETLEQYKDIDEPELDDEVKANIAKYRAQLEGEK
jgi:PPK2 family polyphosphate:nucleotide phosphotransferase